MFELSKSAIISLFAVSSVANLIDEESKNQYVKTAAKVFQFTSLIPLIEEIIYEHFIEISSYINYTSLVALTFVPLALEGLKALARENDFLKTEKALHIAEEIIYTSVKIINVASPIFATVLSLFFGHPLMFFAFIGITILNSYALVSHLKRNAIDLLNWYKSARE